MPNDLLNIRARGLDEVKYLLEGFEGTRAVGVVTEAAAHEIVEVMREQPAETPYQSVSRAEAYGQVANDGAPAGYFSWKQFRYVMASIADGSIKIPYERTGEISGAWHVAGNLSQSKVFNYNEKAPYVFGNESQSRHEQAVGWSKVGARLAEYSNRIFDAAYDAFRMYLDSRRK